MVPVSNPLLYSYKRRIVISDEHRDKLNKYFGFDRGIASVEGFLFPIAERKLYYRKQRKAVRDDLNEACLLLIPFLQRKLPVIYNEFWVQFIGRMKNEVHPAQISLGSPDRPKFELLAKDILSIAESSFLL